MFGETIESLSAVGQGHHICNPKFGHFMLLSGRHWIRNVPKCEMQTWNFRAFIFAH